MMEPKSGLYGNSSAKQNESQHGQRRILGYLYMTAACLAISFVCFVILEQVFMPSPDGVSDPAEAIAGVRFDGSSEQVLAWMDGQEAASLEFIECSRVQEVIEDSCFSVQARYLARSPSGGYAAGNKVFFLDSNGNVVNVWTLVR